MRLIGLDVHRDFCVVAISEGGKARRAGRAGGAAGRVGVVRAEPGGRRSRGGGGDGQRTCDRAYPRAACGEVVLAHSRKLPAIAEAKVKTDAVDACTLAELLAADLVPRVWVGDERTRLLRRLVSRRRQLVKARVERVVVAVDTDVGVGGDPGDEAAVEVG